MVKSSKSYVNERVQQLFFEEFAKRVSHRGTKTIQPHEVVEVLVAKDGEKEIKRTTESIQPDLTVTNRKTVKSYVLFSVKNKVPILTFSEKLLKGGATLAVTFDLDGMAEQAAELAVEMLSDGEEPAVSVAPRPKTIINQRV